MERSESSLVRAVSNALIWGGAFFWACTWFLVTSPLLENLPPTAAVGIGRVTVDRISKMRDYGAAALFYLLVPILTLLFHRAGQWLLARMSKPLRPNVRHAALLSAPFLLSPFFFLTTRKELWAILLPPFLAIAAVRGIALFQTRYEIRSLFSPRMRPHLWLLSTEAAAWMIFRYLVTGKRIAHIPTLFLEVVFIFFFVALFILVAVFAARLVATVFHGNPEEALAGVALGATPILFLPFAGLTQADPQQVIVGVILISVLSIALVLRRSRPLAAARIWSFVAWIAAPALVFVVSYASIAQLSQWIDLFHRGEALGPASDYLRGKVPYRDVFVLHGMLENGLLDSWLMKVFGRSPDVTLTRLTILASLTMPMLWLISMVVLRSIPLSLLTIVFGYVISADNQRALPQLLVILFLLAGIRHRNVGAILLSGFFAGLAVFYSLDMGIYSVIGGAGVLLLAMFAAYPRRWLPLFLLGILLGSAPFLLYLGLNEALALFFRESFLTVPSIIDSVWSLPFPDLSAVFRDSSVRTPADFVLSEKLRFILNPLILVMALLVAIVLLRSRKGGTEVHLLLALVLFGILTQRSALGRADFEHQYFSAFHLPVILAILTAIAGRLVLRHWSNAGPGERTLMGVMLALILPVFIIALWMPDLLNARLDETIRYRSRITGGTEPEARGAQSVDRLRAVQNAAARLTRHEDFVFDFSNQPALYFFMNRRNPTRFYQVPVLSPIRHQMEAIRTLDAVRPVLIFRRSPENFHAFDGIENELRAAALSAWIDDHYAFAENVRGIELWRPFRRTNRPLDSYRRFFQLPPAGTAPKQRFIFPSVGSVQGVASSFWKSDLIVHNPHTLPMRLRLRYTTGVGVARDRFIDLAPGRTVQYTDFIAGLFESPDTRGALWVEFAADRRPLMRVATQDVSRGNSASIDPPLFDTDAAVADTVLNQLSLVGARVSGEQRVNLGVINVGSAPAHFRITATDSAGNIVGVPAEGMLNEDQSYLMVHAGAELGVPFHEPVVVRIRMLSGKTIAYASVVNPVTGTHVLIPGVPSHAP